LFAVNKDILYFVE